MAAGADSWNSQPAPSDRGRIARVLYDVAPAEAEGVVAEGVVAEGGVAEEGVAEGVAAEAQRILPGAPCSSRANGAEGGCEEGVAE